MEQPRVRVQRLRNKMANTEKPTPKAEQKRQVVAETGKKEDKLQIDKKMQEKTEASDKTKKKKPVKGTEKPKVKKSEAVVNGIGLGISTKYSAAICKFIKNKRIEEAVQDLEKVLLLKKAVPMKGEVPHRKGKIMAGKYPIRAAKQFILLLKNLQANSNVNELADPVIAEAVANMGSRPYGRFGSVKRKRTSVRIVAKEISKKKEQEEKK